MGLKWSKPKKSKNGQWIITDSTIPDRGEPYAKELWDLWKKRKDDIKSDGFSLKKDNYYPGWKVTYFHKIGADSMQKPGGGNKMNWRIDYDEKVAKWKAIIEKMKKANGDNNSDLPKDNRRVVKKAGSSTGPPVDDGDDDGTLEFASGSGGGFSGTSVTAEQLALELGDLNDSLELE